MIRKKALRFIAVFFILCLLINICSNSNSFAEANDSDKDHTYNQDSTEIQKETSNEEKYDEEENIITDEIIVVYKNNKKSLSDESIKTKLGIISETDDLIVTDKKNVVMKTQNKDRTEQINIIEELKKDPNVESASRNIKLSFDYAEPNDPMYKTGQKKAMETISAQWAWDKIQGTNTIGQDQNEVVVAVIDTGIETTHEDLRDNIWNNPNPDPALNDIHGYNFVDGNNDVGPNIKDSESKPYHGTKVAGVIGAAGNNGKGISGIAWNIKMASVVVQSIDQLINAVEYASVKGFPIINLSASYQTSKEEDIRRFKEVCMNYHGLIVCNAGNESLDIDKTCVFPARLRLPNMIVAGSINAANERSSFSNFGRPVNIYAPGEGYLTTDLNNTYSMAEGTSFSAPLVSGAAAMLYASQYKLYKAGIKKFPADLKKDILQAADPINIKDPAGKSMSVLKLNVEKLFPYRFQKYKVPVGIPTETAVEESKMFDDHFHLFQSFNTAKKLGEEDGLYNWFLKPKYAYGWFNTNSYYLSRGFFNYTKAFKMEACNDGTFILKDYSDDNAKMSCDLNSGGTEKTVSFSAGNNGPEQRWSFYKKFMLKGGGGSYTIRNIRDPEGTKAGTSFEDKAYTINAADDFFTIMDNDTKQYIQAPGPVEVDIAQSKIIDDSTKWSILPIDNNYIIQPKLYKESFLTLSQDNTRIVLDYYNEPSKQKWDVDFEPEVQIFEDKDYSGKSQNLIIGKYNVNDLRIGNDKLSSFKIPKGLIVTLYEDEDFKGKSITYTDNSYDLDYDWIPIGNVMNFNDKTSSIVVENRKDAIIGYTDSEYDGYNRTFTVGRYNVEDIKNNIGNDSIDSIEIPKGLKVTVYEDQDFSGKSITFKETVPTLGKFGFHDKISSLIVEFDPCDNYVQPSDRLYQSSCKGDDTNLIPGDYNGDGYTDFIRQEKGFYARDEIDTFMVFFSREDGTYQTVEPNGAEYQANCKGDDCNLIPGDYNGDGRTDLIRQDVNSITVYLSKGDGYFDLIRPANQGGVDRQYINIIPGDYNGDGKTDFIRQEKGFWADDSNLTVQVYLSTGDGQFNIITPAGEIQSQCKGDLTNLIPGDYNGDGSTDFLRQEKGDWDDDDIGTVQLYFSKGNGEFDIKTPAGKIQSQCKGDLTNLIPGDYNGDGKTDFIRQEKASWDDDNFNTFNVYLSAGNNEFGIDEPIDGGYQEILKGDLTNLIPGDYNGDGKSDFIRQEKAEFATDNINTFRTYFSSSYWAECYKNYTHSANTFKPKDEL